MPAAVLLALQGIAALISAAPQIESIVTSAKNLIDAMFTAKLITADQQNALKARVDADCALALAGLPVHWQVEPDPQ